MLFTNGVDSLPVQTVGGPQVSQGSGARWEGQLGRRGVEALRQTPPELACQGRWESQRSLAG